MSSLMEGIQINKSANGNGSKQVLVLGGAYAGARATELLSKDLPLDWKVIMIDKQSHFNHIYPLPRYSTIPSHAQKAFIPFTNLMNTKRKKGEGKGDDNNQLPSQPNQPKSESQSHSDSDSDSKPELELEIELDPPRDVLPNFVSGGFVSLEEKMKERKERMRLIRRMKGMERMEREEEREREEREREREREREERERELERKRVVDNEVDTSFGESKTSISSISTSTVQDDDVDSSLVSREGVCLVEGRELESEQEQEQLRLDLDYQINHYDDDDHHHHHNSLDDLEEIDLEEELEELEEEEEEENNSFSFSFSSSSTTSTSTFPSRSSSPPLPPPPSSSSSSSSPFESFKSFKTTPTPTTTTTTSTVPTPTSTVPTTTATTTATATAITATATATAPPAPPATAIATNVIGRSSRSRTITQTPSNSNSNSNSSLSESSPPPPLPPFNTSSSLPSPSTPTTTTTTQPPTTTTTTTTSSPSTPSTTSPPTPPLLTPTKNQVIHAEIKQISKEGWVEIEKYSPQQEEEEVEEEVVDFEVGGGGKREDVKEKRQGGREGGRGGRGGERVRVEWEYLVYALGANRPKALMSNAWTKKEGVKGIVARQNQIRSASSILIVGGGAAGIQYALDIVDWYNVNTTNTNTTNNNNTNDKDKNKKKKRITLVHSRSKFLDNFDPFLHREVYKALIEKGVELILEDRVGMDPLEVGVDDNSDNNKSSEVEVEGVAGSVNGNGNGNDIKEKAKSWDDLDNRGILTDGKMREWKTEKGRKVLADCVLVCTGQRPNSQLLGAEWPECIIPPSSTSSTSTSSTKTETEAETKAETEVEVEVETEAKANDHQSKSDSNSQTKPPLSKSSKTPISAPSTSPPPITSTTTSSSSTSSPPPPPPPSQTSSPASHIKVNRPLQVVDFGTGFPIADGRIFAVGDVVDGFGAVKAGHTGWNQAGIAVKNILKLIEKGENPSLVAKGGSTKHEVENEVENGNGIRVEEEDDEEYDDGLEDYYPGMPMIKVTLGLYKSVIQSQLDPNKTDLNLSVVETDGTPDAHWEMLWQGKGLKTDDPWL